MDNLTLNQQQNETSSSCSDVTDTIHKAVNTFILFFSIPTTFVVIVKLLRRIYKARSFSSAEIFLLQINLANVCLFMVNLLRFLDMVQAISLSMTLFTVFYSPTLTARPIFLFFLCGIFYVAIVHPVTYLTAKTWRHWEWLVITLAWLYALGINVAVIVYEIEIFSIIYILFFYNTLLPSMFFNIATLRALSSSGPENSGQPLNPAKKKALRIITGILVMLLVYYFPRVLYYTYPYVAPPTYVERFMCVAGPVIMYLPKFSEVVMPVIFLYSVRKLEVD